MAMGQIPRSTVITIIIIIIIIIIVIVTTIVIVIISETRMTCYENVNAKLQYSVCFIVNLPSAPEPPVVTEIGTTSCTVTYQPPQDDGGAPVTGYRLERCIPGSDSEWIRVNDTPVTLLHYTVENLTPATEYRFCVAAENMYGTSDFSQKSCKTKTAVILF